jgi:translation initiation factor 3 subunit K
VLPVLFLRVCIRASRGVSLATSRLTLTQSYQFNPHLGREETITNILVKSLTVFPSPDFSLCLALLPPHVLTPTPSANSLAEAVQKLNTLHSQLIGASYDAFWSSLDGDDIYADLIADVQGFEELMRVRQAVVISQTMQSVERAVLESWLNLNGEAFDKFVKEVCGWTVEGSSVSIPLNKENEARGTVVRENVKFDRKFFLLFLIFVMSETERLTRDPNYRILENDQESIRAARINDRYMRVRWLKT